MKTSKASLFTFISILFLGTVVPAQAHIDDGDIIYFKPPNVTPLVTDQPQVNVLKAQDQNVSIQTARQQNVSIQTAKPQNVQYFSRPMQTQPTPLIAKAQALSSLEPNSNSLTGKFIRGLHGPVGTSVLEVHGNLLNRVFSKNNSVSPLVGNSENAQCSPAH